MPSRKQTVDALRDAFQQRNLTLYLGAGVSVANGLPTWEKLVLAMYFSAISHEKMGGWRPFPNYLFAIAEWHLARSDEPLEITARKIRQYYTDPGDFLHSLRETLYVGLSSFDQPDKVELIVSELRGANATLDAVARLCEAGFAAGAGVKSVVTYNYDNLLETVLHQQPVQPIWSAVTPAEDVVPVYHVHGYVPPEAQEGSQPHQIIFTEDQYHLAAQDAYAWSNLVQLHTMSSSVGLMVGLSLADRNMRRLLDALTRTALPLRIYALLQEEKWEAPTTAALDGIHEKAQQYMEKFERSGVKRPGVKADWRGEIEAILHEVERVGRKQKTQVLEQIGVTPLWYKAHEEIPAILAEIYT